jgi:hypothetical protein
MTSTNKTLKLLLLVFSLSSEAFALIGETEAECAKRYGNVMLRLDEDGGVTKVGFAKDERVVVARFSQGKAVSLTFSKFNEADEEVPFSRDEVDAILGAYGDRKEWSAVLEDGARGELLINKPQKLVANVGGKVNSLLISSKAFFESNLNEGREALIKAPEGLWDE